MKVSKKTIVSVALTLLVSIFNTANAKLVVTVERNVTEKCEFTARNSRTTATFGVGGQKADGGNASVAFDVYSNSGKNQLKISNFNVDEAGGYLDLDAQNTKKTLTEADFSIYINDSDSAVSLAQAVTNPILGNDGSYELWLTTNKTERQLAKGKHKITFDVEAICK